MTVTDITPVFADFLSFFSFLHTVNNEISVTCTVPENSNDKVLVRNQKVRI
jgi:hypothetical protein